MNFWLNLPRPLIGLSPMDGVTDAAFRSVIARQGKPDVNFTEFTHVQDVCHGPEFHLETLLYSEIERPIVAQLYGKDPDLFYRRLMPCASWASTVWISTWGARRRAWHRPDQVPG